MELERIKQLIKQDKLVKFYQCYAWRKLRKKALVRDNNECQRCKVKGKYSKATNVHHMKEVKEFPEFALILENLECLCIRCHNDEHRRLDNINEQKPKIMNEERW